MRKSTRKELVNKLLAAVFVNVNHANAMEREVSGCVVVVLCML